MLGVDDDLYLETVSSLPLMSTSHILRAKFHKNSSGFVSYMAHIYPLYYTYTYTYSISYTYLIHLLKRFFAN